MLRWTAAALALISAPPLVAAEPLTPGTMSIEASAAQPDLKAATPVFADAVGKAFETRGFTLLEGSGHAALVVELRLSRSDVGTGTAKVAASKASAGPGGSEGVGASLIIPLPTGKSRTVALQQTRLEVRVARRGDPQVIWQGAAVTVRPAGTRQGRDDAIATALSNAILRDYPAAPQDVVSVP